QKPVTTFAWRGVRTIVTGLTPKPANDCNERWSREPGPIAKGVTTMMTKMWKSGAAAAAGALMSAAAGLGPATAQTTEISFFYPVAVGGPITKIIDGYAADFQKENPTIKVTPIYAGTYQ